MNPLVAVPRGSLGEFPPVIQRALPEFGPNRPKTFSGGRDALLRAFDSRYKVTARHVGDLKERVASLREEATTLVQEVYSLEQEGANATAWLSYHATQRSDAHVIMKKASSSASNTSETKRNLEEKKRELKLMKNTLQSDVARHRQVYLRLIESRRASEAEAAQVLDQLIQAEQERLKYKRKCLVEEADLEVTRKAVNELRDNLTLVSTSLRDSMVAAMEASDQLSATMAQSYKKPARRPQSSPPKSQPYDPTMASETVGQDISTITGRARVTTTSTGRPSVGSLNRTGGWGLRPPPPLTKKSGVGSTACDRLYNAGKKKR